jgi:hypothetical protein
VLAAGPGAQLSHQTAAEINRLTDRPSPFIHVTIPANRRITPPKGVIIHLSSNLSVGWRFAPGVPPYTFAEETIVDLVHAASDLNDVIACVTGGFAKSKVSEGRRDGRVDAAIWLGGRHQQAVRLGQAGAHRANRPGLYRTPQTVLAGLRSHHNCGRPASQCKRPVTGYVSSAFRTASVSVRSGSTACAPAAASSPAV